MQPPPTFLFCTVVSVSPYVTVVFGSDTAQPTFTDVRVVTVSPSAYVTVSFAVYGTRAGVGVPRVGLR